MNSKSTFEVIITPKKNESHSLRYFLKDFIEKNKGTTLDEFDFSKHSDAGYSSYSDRIYVGVYRGVAIVLHSHVTLFDGKNSSNYLEITTDSNNPNAGSVVEELQKQLHLHYPKEFEE